MTAPTNRPPGFDAALVAYLPTLRRQATFMAGNRADGEELLQEAVDTMLRRAGNCKMETFKTWAQIRLRGTASALRVAARTEKRCGRHVDVDWFARRDDDERAPFPPQCRIEPSQEAAVDLHRAVTALSTISHGDIVLRRAMGVLLEEIGEETGTSRENIRQKEERARRKLVERMAA